jgi:hypothetical protein
MPAIPCDAGCYGFFTTPEIASPAFPAFKAMPSMPTHAYTVSEFPFINRAAHPSNPSDYFMPGDAGITKTGEMPFLYDRFAMA